MTADWHQEMTGGHADLSKDMRAAWAKLLCCLAALAVLAMALPGPGDLVSTVVDTVTGVGQGSDRAAAVGGRAPDAAAGFLNTAGLLNTAEQAVLLAAGLIVWVLLVWALAIVIIAALGRLPGTGGSAARKALRRIAPAAAGRLVIAAVGVTAIAGAAGCAAPDGTSAPLVSAAQIAATSVAATIDDSATPLLDIDWPDPAADSGSGTPAPTSSAAGIASSSVPTIPTAESSPLLADDPAAPDSTAPTAGSSIADPSASTPAESALAESTPPDLAAPDKPGPDTPALDTPGSTAPTATPSGANPAGADPSSPASTTDPDSPPSSAPSSATPTPAAESATRTTGAAPEADSSVTVRSGDTLWAIAARHLPSGATDAEIDTGWRAWYAANVDVIGANPDLIIPGQHLLPGHSEMRP